MLFHSNRDQKFQNRKYHLSCWRFTGTLWPDLGGQLQEQRIPVPKSLPQPAILLPLQYKRSPNSNSAKMVLEILVHYLLCWLSEQNLYSLPQHLISKFVGLLCNELGLGNEYNIGDFKQTLIYCCPLKTPSWGLGEPALSDTNLSSATNSVFFPKTAPSSYCFSVASLDVSSVASEP